MRKLMLVVTLSVLALVIALPVSADNGDVQPGDLIINEIMYNPSGDEPETEWFEVYNNTGGSLDMDGCAFSEESGDIFTIPGGTDLTVASGDYFVFGHTDNLNYSVDYVYGGGSGSFFGLNNSGDGDIITIECPDSGGTLQTIDVVNYDDSGEWPSGTDGYAISFGVPSGSSGDYDSDNDTGSNWGHSTSQIGTTGDYGTPGAINDDVLGPNAITLASFNALSPFVALSAALLLAAGLVLLRR